MVKRLHRAERLRIKWWGGTSGILVVNQDSNYTLDHTWVDIRDALASNKIVVVMRRDDSTEDIRMRCELVVDAYPGTNYYAIATISSIYNASEVGVTVYETTTEDGYPSAD